MEPTRRRLLQRIGAVLLLLGMGHMLWAWRVEETFYFFDIPPLLIGSVLLVVSVRSYRDVDGRLVTPPRWLQVLLGLGLGMLAVAVLVFVFILLLANS